LTSIIDSAFRFSVDVYHATVCETSRGDIAALELHGKRATLLQDGRQYAPVKAGIPTPHERRYGVHRARSRVFWEDLLYEFSVTTCRPRE
jgi:hypothetical protein